MSSISYRPEVDGLRAIAVIPVVLFHLGFNWIEGGYLGVDVFFVISGFLITLILLKENASGSFSFVNFWLRRIRRILPALLVMVIITLLSSYFIVFKPILKAYASDGASAIFSYANIAMLLKFGDYWGHAAEGSPFLHSWSLSVEEQFYILYPGLIYLLLKYKIKPFNILAILTLLSFLSFLISSVTYPTVGFYLLPTRAWEMACGGLLAIVTGRQIPNYLLRLRNWYPSAGLFLILSSYFLPTGSSGIGIMAILPVLGSILVIWFSNPLEPVGRLLGSNILVKIGKISYSLYLWHWPVIVISKQFSHRMDFTPSFYLFIVLSIILFTSILSYRFVEIPTRKMTSILTLVSVLLILSLSVIFTYRSPLLDTTYISKFNKTYFYGLYWDITPVQLPVTEGNKAKRDGIYAPERSSLYSNAFSGDGIISGDGHRPEIVLMGDSHGAMWSQVVNEIGEEIKVKRAFFATVGNSPFFNIPVVANSKSESKKGFSRNQWLTYSTNLVKKLDTWKPKILLIACKWSIISQEDFVNLEHLINLAKINHTEVILLNQPPILDMIGDNNSGQYLAFLGYNPNGTSQYIPLIDNSAVHKGNMQIEKIARKYSNCKVLDVNSEFYRSKKALVVNDKSILYYDDDHLSYQGTLLLKQKLKEEIVRY